MSSMLRSERRTSGAGQIPVPRLRLNRERTASDDVVYVHFLGDLFAIVVHSTTPDRALSAIGFRALSRRLSSMTRAQRDIAFAEVVANLCAAFPGDGVKRRYQQLFFSALRDALGTLPISTPIDVCV